MPVTNPVKSGGLLDSLSALAAMLVASVHTRIELLAIDLEEGYRRWLTLFLLVQAALFCIGVGLLLATAMIIVIYWDSHRLLVLGAVAGAYVIAGLAFLVFARYTANTRPRLFATSLSELVKDGQQFIHDQAHIV
jgi:uncharacterized membrane protein YqjE